MAFVVPTTGATAGVPDVVLPSATMTPPGPDTPQADECRQPRTNDTTASNVTVEIATTTTTTPSHTHVHHPGLVQTLTSIVNAVYTETEADIWGPGFERTSADQVAGYIAAGELAVAYLNRGGGEATTTAMTTTTTRVPIGCMHITRTSPTHAEFGMLAVDPAYRGTGAGRVMALFAEQHARDVIFASSSSSTSTSPSLDTNGNADHEPQGNHYSSSSNKNEEEQEEGDAAVRRPTMQLQLHLLVPAGRPHPFKQRLRGWYERMGYVETGRGDFAGAFPALAPLLAGPALYYRFEKVLF
ncbi:hypothetical protein Micbo1qcDRAFT_214963 [Microdochium bolleyi]|uniref:N-acetyltransferase domain-containing protein n=1 Tax=Microdochium bolleyi TaxID=196109 RepID=A0A136ITN5_9PEZI|nr:hypothetical protein Micbo1qcDRAFT_214963 [Microdochium bolleyi]